MQGGARCERLPQGCHAQWASSVLACQDQSLSWSNAARGRCTIFRIENIVTSGNNAHDHCSCPFMAVMVKSVWVIHNR
ncbi:hypothetical protein [Candidatus Kuenenia stuttgartiensis]|uniref:hypothetical protein n=1 Tax=Kuenenia stuttgartiensis TaxID=174633 RepID=UPI001B8AD850|nr:hypothetical protein [Candidatus Kuenenia stuttgartiensis]